MEKLNLSALEKKARQIAPFLVMAPAILGLTACDDVPAYCEPGDTAVECSHRQQLATQEFERVYANQKATQQAEQDQQNYEAYLTQEAEKDEANKLQQQKESEIPVGYVTAEGQGILHVLKEMGVQVEGVLNPMQLSQVYSVKSKNGNFSFTLKDALDGKVDFLQLQIGDCIAIFDPRTTEGLNYKGLMDACSGN